MNRGNAYKCIDSPSRKLLSMLSNVTFSDNSLPSNAPLLGDDKRVKGTAPTLDPTCGGGQR
jgi:hypothetical protein